MTEAGNSSRRPSHFLVRDKKVTKETRLPMVSGGTRCALDKRYAQTAAGNLIFYPWHARGVVALALAAIGLERSTSEVAAVAEGHSSNLHVFSRQSGIKLV